jgi:DNA invertase Pin-like site-specific DNA recombinase
VSIYISRSESSPLSNIHAERPQLKKLIAKLPDGDVVVISAVDRLNRDTTDQPVIARDMQRAGAGLRSLAEPVVDTVRHLRTGACHGGVSAKLERRGVVERTVRGRVDAKAKGVQFGRKPKLTPPPAAGSTQADRGE